MKKTISLVVLAVLLCTPFAYAASVSTTTQVQFNIASVVGFTLTLLGESGVVANSTGAATTAIKFDSATGSDTNLNAQVVGGSTQSDGNPIFSYDNTGTEDLNVSVTLNSAAPACITLKGATTYAGADSGATIATTPVAVVNNFGPNDAAQDWYMKATFSACTNADTTTRILTSLGNQTS